MLGRASNAAIAAAFTPPNEKPQAWDVRPELTTHPSIWNDMTLCVDLATRYDFVSRAYWGQSGSVSTTVGSEGAGVLLGANAYVTPGGTESIMNGEPATGPLTVMARLKAYSGGVGGNRQIFGSFDGSNVGWALLADNNDFSSGNTDCFVFRRSHVSSSGTVMSATTPSNTANDGEMHTVIAECFGPDSATDVNLYLDGLNVTTGRSGDVGTSAWPSNAQDRVGETAGFTDEYGQPINLLIAWKRRLSLSELRILASDPYAPIRPDPTKILPYYVNTSSGTTIAAGVASITLTALAATVSANTTITAGVAAITMTAFAATAIKNTNILAGVASMTMSAKSATVSGITSAGSALKQYGLTLAMKLGL